MTNALENTRNYQKLLRDGTALFLGFAFVYAASVLVGADASPELMAATAPLSLFGWRIIREVLGQGPA